MSANKPNTPPSAAMAVIRRVLIGSLSLYCIAGLAIYLGQRELMFSTSEERVLPSALGIENIEEVTLNTAAGERLYSWYGAARPGHPTILYLQGNGGSVSSRHDTQNQFLGRGYGIFTVGYPGYGGSEGSPTEEGLINAAHLGLRYLRASGISSAAIVIFGESLGTSVAIQLAASEPAAALVLAAPMASIREIAQMQYPLFPVGMLLKDPFLSVNYIGNVHIPVLFFHGSNDLAIPISGGRKLFKLANEPKVFHTIEGAGHNNLFDFQLLDLMDTFLVSLE